MYFLFSSINKMTEENKETTENICNECNKRIWDEKYGSICFDSSLRGEYKHKPAIAMRDGIMIYQCVMPIKNNERIGG